MPNHTYELIDLINERISIVVNKFGTDNTLLTQLFEIRVIYVLLNKDLFLDIIADYIVKLIYQLFKVDHLTYTNSIHSIHSDSQLYFFGEKNYNMVYGGLWSELKKNISNSINTFKGQSDAYQKFLYVIGSKDEWRHYSYPQPFDINLSGRRDPSLFPFHPFLSIDFNFSVSAAGEISILWNYEDNFPSFIYINNISGHFKPYKLSSEALLYMIGKQFNNLKNTTVIAICNDGSVVYNSKQ